jgi:putative transcriptional regulator
MTIMHHPSDTTLGAFAAGTLDEGRAVVVATHLATCPVCRTGVRLFERLRGIALEGGPGVPMGAGALHRAMAAIGTAEAGTQTLEKPAVEQVPTAPAIEYPQPLASYPLGSWHWVGPGLRWRPVAVPAVGDTRVFMLKAKPGTKIAAHEHGGIEWTCVLQGAFRHQFGHYGPGDFDEADESVAHEPVVEDGEECICVVALQGQIRLTGPIGRMLQPFLRF